MPPRCAASFPHPSWAWPRGDLDLLLTAAIASDQRQAETAARQWFRGNDIDTVQFREHRLLLAIVARFGTALSDLPEYPRLVGLQRMLWTKSRMALREALPPLQKIAESGVSVMCLKGAARIAIHPEDQKSRVSHDIDILARPDDAARALDILVAGGWTPSSGESSLCLSARLPELRGINLFFGHFGDIDLHQWGYGPEYTPLETSLWENAQPSQFFEVPVLVPSPEDRLALAIHSSGLDAHAHSDWLVDCAQIINENAPKLDLGRIAAHLKAIDATVQAEVALSYLRDRFALPVPDLGALQNFNATIPKMRRAVILLETKPRTDWSTATRLLRGIAKVSRLRRKRRRDTTTPVLRGRLSRGAAASETSLKHTIPDQTPSAGRYVFEVSLLVKLNGLRRRYEFELNSDTKHFARLRVRNLAGLKGWATIAFKGKLDLPQGVSALCIEARPGKTLRGADPKETARYEVVPFACINAILRPMEL